MRQRAAGIGNAVLSGGARTDSGASCRAARLLAGCLAGMALMATTMAQAPVAGAITTQQLPGSTPRPPDKASMVGSGAGAPSQYRPDRFAGKAGRYYKLVWGIDMLNVKWTESGEVIRFSWRVLDPEKAQVLNDKKADPSLIDPQAGVSLVVPIVDKVGQLRQSQAPQAGRSYWMAFSNKGRYVKRGDRVNVIVGPFRAENLVVD